MPGVVKAKGLPLLVPRQRLLWHCADYRWRELFENADVMSEGATREEPEGAVYYGSSSVLLPAQALGDPSASELRQLEALAKRNPHARLRAVRVACLEAQFRAAGPIGPVSAQLSIRADARGLWWDVEVQADVDDEAQRRGGTVSK